MICAFDPEITFGFVGQIKELSAMPNADDAVGVAVDDQNRPVDMGDLFVVGKLIKGKQGNAGQHSKRGDKRTLQDQRSNRTDGREVDRWSTLADTSPVRKTEADYADCTTYSAYQSTTSGPNFTDCPDNATQTREFDYGTGAPGPMVCYTNQFER